MNFIYTKQSQQVFLKRFKDLTVVEMFKLRILAANRCEYCLM